MRVNRQKLVSGLLAAAFGMLTILGQAMHALPGLNHYGSGDSACGDPNCPFHPRLEKQAKTGPFGGQMAWHDDNCKLSSHNCPLCDFLTLVKPHEDVSEQPNCEFCVQYLAGFDSESADSGQIWPYSARGPPVWTIV